MDIQLKNQVRLLVDNCEDDALLNEAKTILEAKQNDWWNELSLEQQTELSNLLNEPDDKDIISEEAYLNLTARWRT
ncbi:MAG: hypothetical protein KF781_09610 [Chitinophagaceae bacterium]|nr:hypothetical protein [Chitinophagaceae bacterium]MCW5905500.1 hypothetical protein [Chitinophagaceae bacterium]